MTAADPTAVLKGLAKAHLVSAATLPPFRRRHVVRRALADCAYGLGFLEGERLIAIIDDSGGGEFIGYIATNKVVVGRFGDERPLIFLDKLTKIELEEGWLSSTVRATVDGSVVELPMVSGAKALVEYLGAVIEAKDAARFTPTPARAVVEPSEEDPTGLGRLLAVLSDPDPRIVALATLCQQRHVDESAPLDKADALDLAVRIRLLQRQLVVGRGSWKGDLLSVLRPDDLAEALRSFVTPEPILRRSGQTWTLDLGQAPDRYTKERLQEAAMDAFVGKAVGRMLGNDVAKELQGVLDDEEGVVHERLVVDPGPSTTSLAAVEEAQPASNSFWNNVTSGIGELLSSKPKDVTELSVLTFRGLLGTNYRDLATLDPARVVSIVDRLLTLELRWLAARAIVGPDATSAACAIEVADLDHSLGSHLPANHARAILEPPRAL